jgi:hypothetical protein
MITDQALSERKYGSLVIAMMLSSLVSTIASTAVVRISFLKLRSTYQRFLFMLALANTFNSIILIWHPLSIPSDPDYPWAIGNKGSCSTMGFFFLFGSLSVSLYSSCLSVYFFVSMGSDQKYKMPEDVIGPTEFLTHIFCWLCPLSMASTAVGTNSINIDTKSDLCIPQQPCEDLISSNCVEGVFTGESITRASEVIMITYQAILVLATIVGLLATLLVYFRAKTYCRIIGDGSVNEGHNQRLTAVSTQSILYTLAYLNSFIWVFVVWGVPRDADENVYFSFQFLFYFLYPLQGLIICLVYIRPRYQMLKVMYPEDSGIVVLRVSLSTAGDPDEIEEVRATIFGEEYVPPPSVSTSDASRASDIPEMINFVIGEESSIKSMVSAPNDGDSEGSSEGSP